MEKSRLGDWDQRSLLLRLRARCLPGSPTSAIAEHYRGSGFEIVVSTSPGVVLLRAWDELVDRTPGADVTQLSAWTRLRALAGFSSLHLLVRRDGELVGGAQILIRRLPAIGSMGYLAYGPIVAPGAEQDAEVRRSLAVALTALCKRRLRILFVQPPEGANELSADLLGMGFRASTVGIAPAGSIRIDLTDDLAVIKGRFGRKLKSWPNRWASRGVTVRRGDERDLPLLVELMGRSADEQGHTPLPQDYVETLYRELVSTGHAAIFVGEVNGVPVAADLVTRCGDMLRGRLTGFDRSGDAAKLSVPAAIRWEIIKWGKASGYRWLDFGGLRPATLDAILGSGEPPAGGWLPVDQPKLTFGGTAFRYPMAVELISPAPLRMAYDLAWHSAAGRQLIERARALLRGNRPEHNATSRDRIDAGPMNKMMGKPWVSGTGVIRRPESAEPDRRPVIMHVGVLGAVPGGMAQVLHEYLAWSFPTLEVQAMASTLGRGHRWSIGRAVLCAVRIPLFLLSRRPHAFVVHLSSGGSFVREGALVALAKLCGFPVAIHLHGSMFGRFAKRRPRLVRTVLSLPHVIYVLSEEAERLVGEVTNPSARHPARVVKVANGVAIPGEPPGKESVVLFAGEVGGRKGVDVLWEAWSAIAAERPEWRLVVAGPVEPEIDALSTPLGVTMLGTVSRETVLDWETRSAIAVLPSRHEALPMFLLESMARGCATVGTPVGDVARLLEGCGIVVPVDDAVGLAEALAGLMDAPATTAALGAAGRARVIERYSSTVLARTFEREWWSLLHDRFQSPTPT